MTEHRTTVSHLTVELLTTMKDHFDRDPPSGKSVGAALNALAICIAQVVDLARLSDGEAAALEFFGDALTKQLNNRHLWHQESGRERTH
jgi:hypothetical protein